MTDPKPLTPEEEPFLRDRVYAVLHAHECDETPAEHSWREHLPWDSEDDALASERLADALIVAILKPSAAFPDGIPLPSSLLVSTAPIATDEIALPLTPFEEAGLRVAAAVDTADSELTYIGEVKRLLATLDAERAVWDGMVKEHARLVDEVNAVRLAAKAIEQDRAERAARPDNGLPVLDEAYGKTPTYEVAGRCLTCGARFIVRREKGVKPPLSVDCPHCGCTEFGWQDLHYPLAPAQPAPSGLAATLDRLEAAVRSYEHEEDWPAVEDALAALRAAPEPGGLDAAARQVVQAFFGDDLPEPIMAFGNMGGYRERKAALMALRAALHRPQDGGEADRG